MAEKIVAFVARSFDPADEAKIDRIVKFLDSFKALGFISQSAERSEVESVSEKVRSMIDKSDVLVGIFTRRHPVYRFDGGWRMALDVLLGWRSADTWSTWSAPPWVLQESGYALKGKKALILFQEAGVEVPRLQGDLEYIPFDPRNPAPAFQRASQMITGLIAKVGGVKVETTVTQTEVTQTKELEATPAPMPSSSGLGQDEEISNEKGFTLRLIALWKTVISRDWKAAKEKYDEGLAWIRTHIPKRELSWKCTYQQSLFQQGKTEGLEQLRRLAAEYKSEFPPLRSMAECHKDLHEYDEAVRLYLEAASIAPLQNRASLEISAAEALHQAKRPKESTEILLRLRNADYAKEPQTQFRILHDLYSLSKESEDKFPSFAIAELALHERPEEMSFRFSLAHDYGDADQNHMSLYHYRIICDHDENNAGALNNLGVALSENDLPILAVQLYEQSYKLGETLAASNLARKHLDAGLSHDAIILLKDAQTKENCVPEVSRTLTAVYDKIRENNEGQEKVDAEAEQNRKFLLAFAPALFSPTATNLQGRWKLSEGEMELQVSGIELHGIREKISQVNATLPFLSHAPRTVTRTTKLEFSGTLSGRTCKFKLEVTNTEEPLGLTFALGGPRDSKTEGYIVFAEDGRSGQVVELKAGKPEKYYEISKAT